MPDPDPSPHLHVHRVAVRSPRREASFALRLLTCQADRARDDAAIRDLVRRHLRAQADLINTLHQQPGDTTFFLRYISRPHPGMFSTGTMTVVLLGKVSAPTVTAARHRASTLCGAVLRLLNSSASGTLWAPVAGREEFDGILNPFDRATVHVSEICRREEVIPLETFGSRPGLTAATRAAAPRRGQRPLYIVHQFLPRNTTLARMLRLLLLESDPILFQIGLAPTRLAEEERRALHEEIVRIETALEMASRDAGPASRRALEHSRGLALAKTMLELEMRLDHRPFQTQLLVASPQPLSTTVVNGIGGDLTYPVWNRLASKGEDRVLQLHGGGFETFNHHAPAARRRAARNLAELRIEPLAPSDAPPALIRLRSLVDAAEAACAFRFPVATLEGLPGLEVLGARSLPLPAEQAALAADPRSNILVGENLFRGTRQPVLLSQHDRLNHLYIVGQTGTGKTSAMRTMVLDDMRKGRGLAVIDPHGDLFAELLGLVPEKRVDDVVVIDPTDTEFPVGLNLLEYETQDERNFLILEMRDIIERLITDQYGQRAIEWMGPIFFQYMNMGMLLATSNPDDPGTLLEFNEIFLNKDYWQRWLPLRTSHPQLNRWVAQTLPGVDFLQRSKGDPALGEYISSKFNDFLFDPRIRNIFGQKHNSIDFAEIMNRGSIVLVNLAKGELTANGSRFLGMILLAKFQAAAMRRVALAPADRRPFYLYVDEFQTMATRNFISMLSEGRKFGLGLVLANQFLTQIDEPTIMQGIIGNVATQICFRTGREDAEKLEQQFVPYLDRHDLANQPNWHATVRTTVAGQVVPPFTLRTLAPTRDFSPEIARRVREQSRQRHAHPRADVETQIARSFHPDTPTSPDPDRK